MPRSYIFKETEQDSLLECAFFNFPVFEIKVSLRRVTISVPNSFGISSVQVLSRPSRLIKGCNDLLSDKLCNCKATALQMERLGHPVDLMGDLVPNNCTDRRLGSSRENFRTVLSFDFQRRDPASKASVPMLSDEFGKFFIGLVNDEGLRKKLDPEQLMIVNHFSEIISDGDVFYFMFGYDDVCRSEVPNLRVGKKSLDMKLSGVGSFNN